MAPRTVILYQFWRVPHFPPTGNQRPGSGQRGLGSVHVSHARRVFGFAWSLNIQIMVYFGWSLLESDTK